MIPVLLSCSSYTVSTISYIWQSSYTFLSIFSSLGSLNIEMPSHQYRNPRYKDKMVSWLHNLYDGIPLTSKYGLYIKKRLKGKLLRRQRITNSSVMSPNLAKFCLSVTSFQLPFFLKFLTKHGSVTVLICTTFHNNWTTEMDVIDV